MRSLHRITRLAGFLAVALGSTAVSAQTVRGTVRDANTSAPMPGVLVILQSDTGDVTWATGLTNGRGEFSLRAAQAGLYRVTAKRIGSRRLELPVFQLRAAEVLYRELLLEPVAFVLPNVAVRGASWCVTRREDEARIAVLWDEAQTALASASVVVRDSLVRTRLIRYQRTLNPRTLSVVREDRTDTVVAPGAYFRSLSPDSLERFGYWRQNGDTLTFDAPDLSVLLDRSFRRTHCFSLARQGIDGLVGIQFSPVQGRRIADIQGTLWMTANTFELQRIEFSYTDLPRVPNADRIGGEVHFSRVAEGSWIVQRWFIRMPSYNRRSAVSATAIPYHSKDGSANRPLMIERLVENGGLAFLDGPLSRIASLSGLLTDSAGIPVRAARVAIAGAAFSTQTDDSGTFTIDSIPEGAYRLEANDSLSHRLGAPLAQSNIELLGGKRYHIVLRGDSSHALLTRVCGTPTPETALRLHLTRGGTPQSSVAVRLTWTNHDRTSTIRSVSNAELTTKTGNDGTALFCGVPGNVSVELHAQDVDGVWKSSTLRLTQGFTSRVFSLESLRPPQD